MAPKVVNIDRQCQKYQNSQTSIPKPDSSSLKYYKIVPSIYWPSRREFVELVTKHFSSIASFENSKKLESLNLLARVQMPTTGSIPALRVPPAETQVDGLPPDLSNYDARHIG